LNIFGKKNPPLIGLDISSTAVKLIQLSRHGSRYKVDHFAIEPLAPKAVVEKNIENIDVVASAIQRAVKRCGSKAKNCAVAVSGLNETELEAQIEIEANQYIPYALSDVSLDFEVLGTSPRSDELVDVLLAASKTDNIETRQDAVEAAGLIPYIVDVEAYAIGNAFNLIAMRDKVPASDTIVIVEIGANMTSLIVVRGTRVIYTREHPFGGQQLINDIMRRYDMDREQATFFERGEEGPEEFEAEVLEPFQQSIVQQISRSLQFYSSSSDYANVTGLYLAGGCAKIPGLDQIPAMMVATGLALRGFD
jgi:type IV pilus assembly protein PilM